MESRSIKLVSDSWIDGFYMRPRKDRTQLEKYHEGLIICSACIAGEVPAKILKDDIEGAREAIQWYKRVFGQDYYLELQRHEVKDPSIRANRETFPLQFITRLFLISLFLPGSPPWRVRQNISFCPGNNHLTF